MPDKLVAKAKIQITSNASEVFNAIVDQEKMSNYFIEWGSGPMMEGRVVEWKFPEFNDRFKVRIGSQIMNEQILFSWGDGAEATNVVIDIKPAGDNSCIVSISESGKENNEEGIIWMRGNTEGWANFLACLKAWVEYGINLRKGAFDFMRKLE